MDFKRFNVMKKSSYKTLIILLTIPALFLYIHVWKDYSNSIKSIAEPMRDNVLMFKEKYKRYPTTFDESLDLLKLSDCDDVDGKIGSRYEGEHRMVYTCKLWIKNMLVHAVISKPAIPYTLNFYMGYSRCHIRFDDKNRESIMCYQDSLIKYNP